MRYGRIVRGTFLSRPNRFVAKVMLDGEEVTVHVKNTGRCRELLVSGAEVWLEDFTSYPGKRKLMYDLIAVRKGGLLINMDSQAPNKAVKEALETEAVKLPGMGRLTLIKPEQTYEESRFDFFCQDESGQRCFVEVKGVTLENGGIAAFPDAPTERGVKHLRELVRASENGYRAYVLFVIQMSGMKMFRPNDEPHKEFGDVLRFASEHGVTVLAYGCNVTPDSMTLSEKIPIDLRFNG